jgi:hypothetical protein
MSFAKKKADSMKLAPAWELGWNTGISINQRLHHLGDICLESDWLCRDFAGDTGVIEIDADQCGMRTLRRDPFKWPTDDGGGVKPNPQLQKKEFPARGDLCTLCLASSHIGSSEYESPKKPRTAGDCYRPVPNDGWSHPK